MAVRDKIVKRLTTLQGKAEKEKGIAKGDKVEQYYAGCSDSYEQALSIVNDEFSSVDEVEVDYESKMQSRLWKGFAFGIIVGATIFTTLIQWLLSILG